MSTFIEIISKKTFTIISNEFQNPKEPINFTNIPILFGITDNIGNPIPLDPKLVDFSVILNEYIHNIDENGNTNMSHTETEIKIESCDELKDSIDFSLFHDYKISSFKCIKPYQKITIYGTYGDINGYRSLKIMLKRCNNSIHKCYNNDYVELIISNSRFVIAYRVIRLIFIILIKKILKILFILKVFNCQQFLVSCFLLYDTCKVSNI